ncbi:MAG: HigA family addiction module antitoxin [Deltaproteobacteria bacterium]|nr:HigA family addiction module antitoxin [Deltaproteobacteria bacterium]
MATTRAKLVNRPERKREPTHPGTLLREVLLPEAGLSVSETARRLGTSRQNLHRILAAERPVTPKMAVRLGEFFGNGPEVWLNMQVSHDVWHARRALQREKRRMTAAERRSLREGARLATARA